jgi:hypothetical protein
VKHLKSYKIFESVSEQTVREKLYDITDDSNFNIDIGYASRDGIKESMIVFITRGSYQDSRKTREIPGAPEPPGGYPSNLFLWFEIKDTIIRLCEYVYSETESEPIENKTQHPIQRKKSAFRMFNGGVEFGIGWHKEEDFTLGDFISFTSLKLVIKL